MDAPPELDDTRSEAAPWWGPVAVAMFVGLVVCGYFATGLAPAWANDHPEGLIALNARIRHLLLVVGGGIEFWPYALIAGARLALAFAVCHLIGRAYSTQVLKWFANYLGYRDDSINQLQAGFDKVDWLIVPFFTGSNIIAAISGIRRMNPVRLAILLAIGLVGRLLLYWWLGHVFQDQIETVLKWLARYQWPLTIAGFAVVGLTIAGNLRRGRR